MGTHSTAADAVSVSNFAAAGSRVPGNALLSGNSAALPTPGTFFSTFRNDFATVTQDGTPVTASIVDFSTGTAGGTAAPSFAAVPEPGSAAARVLLAAGAASGGLAWRRRGTAATRAVNPPPTRAAFPPRGPAPPKITP